MTDKVDLPVDVVSTFNIQDVIAEGVTHPAYTAVMEILEKLEKGEIFLS